MGAQNSNTVGEFKVVKTTADSLAQASNDLVESGYEEVTHHFTGGRDWVIIGRVLPQ